MITKEMLTEAIRTGHEPCCTDAGCLHEDATKANIKAIEEEIGKCIAYALSAGISPALMVWSAALHVGYKLHQIESTPVAKDKVN